MNMSINIIITFLVLFVCFDHDCMNRVVQHKMIMQEITADLLVLWIIYIYSYLNMTNEQK